MARKEARMYNGVIHFDNDDERKMFFACAKYFNKYLDPNRFYRAYEVTFDKIRQYNTDLDRKTCECPDFKRKKAVCKHLIFLFMQNFK